MRAPEALTEGEHTVQFQFDFDGGQPGAGGNGTLLVDGAVVAASRIERTVPFIYSVDETMDIGCDTASPVTDDYPSGPANRLTAELHWVQIDLHDDDVSHLEDPAQTYHRIMARQ